jgi:hypothetical protein
MSENAGRGCAIVHSFLPVLKRTLLIVDIQDPECDAVVAELRKQGLTVNLHSRQNSTWRIADGGVYTRYIASRDELVDLKRLGKLDIRGIRELG